MNRECRNCAHAKCVLVQRYVECEFYPEDGNRPPLGWFCDRFRLYTEKAEPPVEIHEGEAMFTVPWKWLERQKEMEKRIKALEEKLRGFGRHPTVACSMSVENQKRIEAIEDKLNRGVWPPDESELLTRNTNAVRNVELRLEGLERLIDVAKTNWLNLSRKVDKLEGK